ncbi:MAG TPA: hypothetical protein VFS21_00545 [Roseiflexaceae bacterium]|nr:hypothetical protein [Roseiflexaceae bacterium]
MGSWNDLDAVYPPGALTPATAYVVAFGLLAGARSVHINGGGLAPFLRRWCGAVVPTADLLERAERFLSAVPPEQFLDAAGALLNPEQRHALALAVLDAAPEHPLTARLLAAFGLHAGELRGNPATRALAHEPNLFAQ